MADFFTDFFTHFSCAFDLATRETIPWIDTNDWLARTLAPARGQRGVR